MSQLFRSPFGRHPTAFNVIDGRSAGSAGEAFAPGAI
jgi:hypothetical protein